MSGETNLTIQGNLTADPELRFTNSGVALCTLTVASTPRTFDKTSGEWKDGDTLFMRCSVWRQFAENVAASIRKGDAVIASGVLRQRSYETKEGEKRSSMELEIDAIGPDLRRATASVSRNPRQGQAQGPAGGGFASQPPAHGASYPQPPADGGWSQPNSPAAGTGWATSAGGGAAGDDTEAPF